jgi:hypothetical protein
MYLKEQFSKKYGKELSEATAQSVAIRLLKQLDTQIEKHFYNITNF